MNEWLLTFLIVAYVVSAIGWGVSVAFAMLAHLEYFSRVLRKVRNWWRSAGTVRERPLGSLAGTVLVLVATGTPAWRSDVMAKDLVAAVNDARRSRDPDATDRAVEELDRACPGHPLAAHVRALRLEDDGNRLTAMQVYRRNSTFPASAAKLAQMEREDECRGEARP